MKLNVLCKDPTRGRRLLLSLKTLLTMKLTLILLIAACLQVNAGGGYAQKITLSQKNISLSKLFHEIRDQSGYLFLYNDKQLDNGKKVTIEVRNASIEEVLEQSFKDQSLAYTIIEKTIVVMPKEKVEVPAIIPVIPPPPPPIEIHGRVVNQQGEPLQNVSVLIAETKIGTTTNSDGRFSLTAPDDKNVILEVSSVGYQTKRVSVGKQTEISITLELDVSDLSDVVVVGYGTQKKATVTGSISSIKTKEIKQSPAANLAVTLAGRLPGLTVVQRSGEPGRDLTNMFLRGLGTVNGQAPIILVDGVERAITYIDPNEVASVSILKDVSATAIFGVRGANGVILVTTRRGTSEIPEINFTTEMAAQGFTRFIKPVNSFEHATLVNQARRNDGLDPIYTAAEVQKFKDGSDPVRYPDTDWRDILINDYSFQQRYNLNISGRGKAVNYFVNAGYLEQGGQFKNEKNLPYDPSFKLGRYNFRSNIDIQVSKSLKAFLNLSGYLENQNMPISTLTDISTDPDANLANNSAARDVIAYMFDLSPVIPGPVTPDGDVTTSATWGFPSYGQLNRSGYIQQKRVNIMGTYGMELSLDQYVKGLSAKGVMSFDVISSNNLFALKKYPKMVQVIDKNIKDSHGLDSVYFRPYNDQINSPLQMWGSSRFSQMMNMQASLNYNRSFDKHVVTGLLLFQKQRFIHAAELPQNLIGLASRVTYGYNNKYFLEFNAGYNGSEQFAKGHRYGFFPAVSGAWLISNEDFFDNSRTINMLKLRGSYGLVGNDQISGRRFLYLDDIRVVDRAYSGSLGRGTSVQVNLLGNSALQWEVARKMNIGLELSLLKNSLNVTFDIFSERRDNILRNRGAIPDLNGLSSSTLPPANIGIINNKGFEVELGYKKQLSKDWSFLANFNLSFARNRQISADETILTDDFAYRYRETGYRIGQFFGYQVDGYFNTEEEIKQAAVYDFGHGTAKSGDFRYVDANGDNIIDSRDYVPIGYSAIPEYTFGNAYSIRYKSVDLSILFQGITNVTNYYSDRGTFSKFYYVERHLESWTQERYENGSRISYPRLTTGDSPNEIGNSFFVIDASYIRLKNIELGYTISSPRALDRIGVRSVRVYANGLNLLTWDRLPTKDFDPELNSPFSYPVVKLFNFGINIVF